MQETANILHSATPGPGDPRRDRPRTATFDGLSLLGGGGVPGIEPQGTAETIFATHYHELTDLADALPSVDQLPRGGREWKDDSCSSQGHAGRSDRSYGIQVARSPGCRRRS